jgi:branched-subunit amino acid transport protein AzlD
MPDTGYVVAAVLVAAGITWALRAAPFLMLARAQHSHLLTFLGERMPVGIMVILTAYTVRHVAYNVPASAAPVLVALAVTVGLQLWRRNATLSIFAGTAVSVLLASSIAALS